MVEFALVFPLLLVLLLMAVDFGRVYFGWVTLTNASRVGANYAAAPPDMSFDDAQYQALIAGEARDLIDGTNCAMEPPPHPEYTTPTGDPAVDPVLGDYATVTLTCTFEPLTPLSALFVGDGVVVEAETIFPMRSGCVDCGTASAPSPPTPPDDPCRLLPEMEGMSVAGARLAWESAGFLPERFTPISGNDSAQVDGVFPTEDDPDAICDPDHYTFSSSVIVTMVAPDPIVGSCETVPNLIGTVVADARQAWVDAGFAADNFDPPDLDAQVVTGQTTDPASDPGVSCEDPNTTTVTAVTGDPWPNPPPAPCQVPNLIDKTRADAQADWDLAGFDTNNFSPPDGGWQVKWQSLVGGDMMSCGSSITVSQQP